MAESSQEKVTSLDNIYESKAEGSRGKAEGILLRMFCKFWFDARNRWYAPASVFRSESRKKRSSKITTDRVFETTFPL